MRKPRHQPIQLNQPAPTDTDIERAERVLAELRETIVEARGTRSDLLGAIRESKAYIGSEINRLIERTIKAGLDDYKATLNDAMRKGRDKVLSEFKRLTEMMLNLKHSGNRASLISILEVSAILDKLTPGDIDDPEALMLILEMKVDQTTVTPQRVARLLELLRPLAKGNESK